MLYNRSFHDMTLSNFASKDPLIDKSPIYNIYIDLHKNNNIRFFFKLVHSVCSEKY
jgi:hypothetical protein